MKSPESSLLPRVLLGTAAGATVSLGISSAHAADVGTILSTPLTIGTAASGSGKDNAGVGAIYFDPQTGNTSVFQTQANSTTAQAEPAGSSNTSYNFSLGYGAAGNRKGASTANHPIFNALASDGTISQQGSVLYFNSTDTQTAVNPLAPRFNAGNAINSSTYQSLASSATTVATASLHNNNKSTSDANSADTNPYQWTQTAQRGYLGFSFVANATTPSVINGTVAAGTTLYGWAEVQYVFGGNEGLTLYSFGYEDSGNAASAGAVPEPATLLGGALIGASGLLSYRRRRAVR